MGGDGLYGLFVPRCLFIVESLWKLWTVGMETSMNMIADRLTSGLTEPCQQRNLHPLCRKRTYKLGIQLRSSYRSREPTAVDRILHAEGRWVDFEKYEDGLQICLFPFRPSSIFHAHTTKEDCSTNAHQPMTWPDHISVFHKLRSLPSPTDGSFILDVIILSELHQRPAARCIEDIVVYDYRKGMKTELRPFMMDAFRETWEKQEDAKRRMGEKIRELDWAVRELERGSWDQEGAVEDMGSAR